MATARASGYVVTHTVWNAVLAQLTDDGGIYSGAFNGSTVTGTTGSFSSTLAVTGASTLSGVVTVNAADTRGFRISRSAANAGMYIQSSGGSGKAYSLVSDTSGVFAIQDDADATPRIQLSGNNIDFAASSGVTNANYYNSATEQPGFLAYNSVDDTTISSGTNVDFDTEVYDEGGDFASDTFTAPVAGRYLLSTGVMLSNVSGGALDVGAYIRTSNFTNGYYIGYRESVANNDQIQFSGSVIVDMDAADTATVQVYLASGSITVRGGTTGNTWFCGRLLP